MASSTWSIGCLVLKLRLESLELLQENVSDLVLSYATGHFSRDVWKKSTPDWSGITFSHALPGAACDGGAWLFCV